jgi:uncharacterized iron-regulated membrane protein
MGRLNPLWFAQGWWRTLHRVTAIVSSLFLLLIATTGMLISISSCGVVISRAMHHGSRPVITEDLSKPLTDAELPGMLHTTLSAYRAANPGVAIRVLRLRYFAGMPQGVVVSGAKVADQLVYNAVSGRPASLTEPNYPPPGQTFGWQADETLKEIHRGDFFGLSGRLISLLCGFALLYLSVSGAVMYCDMWNRRRAKGRWGLFWN